MVKFALISMMSAVSLVACAGATSDTTSESQAESELNQQFRSPLHELGDLALEPRTIGYAEDPRPFETSDLGLAQQEGQSPYVSYRFQGTKGDGLLLSAHRSNVSSVSGSCDEIVRLWLLDGNDRVVRTGTQSCEAVYEEPGLESKSNILRHYLEQSGTYKIVVAVLPARLAPASAPIRTQPWKWVTLDVVRSHEADQGELLSRCQDGTDILCKPSLKCERAYCKANP